MSPRPQPWHPKALALRAQEPPPTFEAIAEELGLSTTHVARFLNPQYGERQREASRLYEQDIGRERRRDRYRNDPEYRRRRLEAVRRSMARRKEREAQS